MDHGPKSAVIEELASRFGTPLYIFEESRIRLQCKELKAAIPYPNAVFRYALKALSNSSILKIIKDEGFGLDASSFNEVRRGLHVGYKASDIQYTGEGADRAEFEAMINFGVAINCSSLDQIRLVGKIKAGTSISLRINPGVGDGHHFKVNTGGPKSKHGVYFEEIAEAKKVSAEFGLQIVGIHTHIGSGTDLGYWLKIKDVTLALAKQFADLRSVNLGGGFPVVYRKGLDKPMPIKEWGSELSKSMELFSREVGREIELQLEPGRFLVAESGFLVAEVQSFKRTPDFNFVIVNSGFNHNPRPMLYGAHHPITFISKNGDQKRDNYVVAGNLCESGDIFTVNAQHEPVSIQAPILEVGDLMVMELVGAYCYSMMSEYNSMTLPAAVLITEDGGARLIERRGQFEDLLLREV